MNTESQKTFKRSPFNILRFSTTRTKKALISFSIVLFAILLTNALSFYKMYELFESSVNVETTWFQSWAKNALTTGAFLFFVITSVLVYWANLSLSAGYAGPIIAILRHLDNLAQGNYKSRVYLRTKDQMKDLEEKANSLAETLEKKYGNQDEQNKTQPKPKVG